MDDLNTLVSSMVKQVYEKGVKPCIVEEEKIAFLFDPVFHIKRNRVIAETVKAALVLDLESDTTLITKLLDYLISTQHQDGSWSEIHAHYDQPSALITSIVGSSFLKAITYGLNRTDFVSVVKKAKDFVLAQEQEPGFYLKSTHYTADHLNVDATCAAFLDEYASVFDDEPALEASKRASDHIIDHQWDNGVYPYVIDKGSYSYVKQVPCIHYQGVTLFYLSLIHKVTDDNRLKESLLSGGRWLAEQQRKDGRFDWSQSGLLFTYYVSGANAFALSSFQYLSLFDSMFESNAKNCFPVLKKLKDSLFFRWEQADWSSFLKSLFDSIDTAKLAPVGLKQTLFRFGYAGYRQIARRRYDETVDDRLFNMLVSLFHLQVSTVEPFANYPDLFMSSEIIDCLSSIKEMKP